MQRWRKPPIFAFAYISPARSSKRRISIIFSRTVRQVSLSGSECEPPPAPPFALGWSSSRRLGSSFTAMRLDDTPLRAPRTLAVRTGTATSASPASARSEARWVGRLGLRNLTHAMIARAPDAAPQPSAMCSAGHGAVGEGALVVVHDAGRRDRDEYERRGEARVVLGRTHACDRQERARVRDRSAPARRVRRQQRIPRLRLSRRRAAPFSTRVAPCSAALWCSEDRPSPGCPTGAPGRLGCAKAPAPKGS